MTRKLVVHRKAYKKKGGTRVKASTFKVEDRGKKGRTPKSERFFHPLVHMGWQKNMDAESRRRLALNAHDGDELATARALLALSNTTTDKATKRLARVDANYFFGLHRRGGCPK